jgi:hypothetical protein
MSQYPEGVTMQTWKLASAALVAGALSFAGGVAHAAAAPDVVVAGATNGSAAPGGTAFTSFTLAFGGTYEFIGIAMTMDYDPARLTFDPLLSSVSILGSVVSLPVFLAQLAATESLPMSDFDVYGGEDPPGHLYFGAGYTVSGSTSLTGDIVVTTAFKLAPSFAVGSHSVVDIKQLDIADLNTGIVSLASAEIPVSMTVSAVPEPESWLMLLAGLGLLGGVARRRVARC